jgi:hypothetical protein
MLLSIECQSVTDVSGYAISPTFKVQVLLDCLTLADVTDTCNETLVTNYQSTLSNIHEERIHRSHRRGNLKPRLLF